MAPVHGLWFCSTHEQDLLCFNKNKRNVKCSVISETFSCDNVCGRTTPTPTPAMCRGPQCAQRHCGSVTVGWSSMTNVSTLAFNPPFFHFLHRISPVWVIVTSLPHSQATIDTALRLIALMTLLLQYFCSEIFRVCLLSQLGAAFLGAAGPAWGRCVC